MYHLEHVEVNCNDTKRGSNCKIAGQFFFFMKASLMQLLVVNKPTDTVMDLRLVD